MAKTKTQYVCQNCGAVSVKWQGKCNVCGEWNTFAEEIVSTVNAQPGTSSKPLAGVEKLDNFKVEDVPRIILPESEFNRVVGGGLVPGSVILLAGEPGIGKSTLLLQLLLKIKDFNTLYVSGEESISQIKIRASRLGTTNPHCYLSSETITENIAQWVEKLNPGLVVVDSIQTMQTSVLDSAPGSIGQIRESAAYLIRLAKNLNIPIILVGHITKEGFIAGPKVLEHMVDTVLYFEGDKNYDYRILRTIKNRFGPVSDLGVYQMHSGGLAEIKNPSDILLSHREEDISGVAIASTMEGIRPLLVEIQALVTPTYYGMPQRNTTGMDNKRLSMLLAVLQKRCGFKISNYDVFVNAAGGMKLTDPATDLAIIAAIASSYLDLPLPPDICFAGETGLSGEIRPVKFLNNRISDIERLGFGKMVISAFNQNIPVTRKLKLIKFKYVTELIDYLKK
ncbi:MAG: DNA repair protein RadA [Calditrichaeota bacterium]|nr:MAG: DNA repair protein RadA [Calditrichota bacterium]